MFGGLGGWSHSRHSPQRLVQLLAQSHRWPTSPGAWGWSWACQKCTHREKREVDLQSKDHAVYKECHIMRNPFWVVFTPKREGTDGLSTCRGQRPAGRGSRPGVPEPLCSRPGVSAASCQRSCPRAAPPGGQHPRLVPPTHTPTPTPGPVSSTAWLDRCPELRGCSPRWEASRALGPGSSTASCRPAARLLAPGARAGVAQSCRQASCPLGGLGALLAPRAELAGLAHLSP